MIVFSLTLCHSLLPLPYVLVLALFTLWPIISCCTEQPCRSNQRGVVAGSVGFKDALLGNQHWLEGTQLVVISNTQWVGETMPCLTYGMRGMIALSIEVCTALLLRLMPI